MNSKVYVWFCVEHMKLYWLNQNSYCNIGLMKKQILIFHLTTLFKFISWSFLGSRYIYYQNQISFKFHKITWVYSWVQAIDLVKPKTIKFVIVDSLPSMQHLGERAKTGWLRITIMWQNGVTYLSEDCCFSELALWKKSLKIPKG